MYYSTRIDPQYGLMLVYDVAAPWNDTVYPRYLNYTAEFQNSTGLCRYYSQHGTEYCCDGVNMGCLEVGERSCSDGSNIRLVNSNTKLHYISYQEIEQTPSYPEGFFSYYYPNYPSMQANTETKTITEDEMPKTEVLFFMSVFPVFTLILGSVK